MANNHFFYIFTQKVNFNYSFTKLIIIGPKKKDIPNYGRVRSKYKTTVSQLISWQKNSP